MARSLCLHLDLDRHRNPLERLFNSAVLGQPRSSLWQRQLARQCSLLGPWLAQPGAVVAQQRSCGPRKRRSATSGSPVFALLFDRHNADPTPLRKRRTTDCRSRCRYLRPTCKSSRSNRASSRTCPARPLPPRGTSGVQQWRIHMLPLRKRTRIRQRGTKCLRCALALAQTFA